MLEIVLAPDLIFSYGIYDNHNMIDPVKGTQGRLLVVFNEAKWYEYDRENNDDRARTPYTFYLSREEYLGLLIFYITIVAQSDIKHSKYDYIEKCVVKTGKYVTYKLFECNCTTIIRDALLTVAPGSVLRACYMSGLNFSGFTKVYVPSMFGLYMKAMAEYC